MPLAGAISLSLSFLFSFLLAVLSFSFSFSFSFSSCSSFFPRWAEINGASAGGQIGEVRGENLFLDFFFLKQKWIDNNKEQPNAKRGKTISLETKSISVELGVETNQDGQRVYTEQVKKNWTKTASNSIKLGQLGEKPHQVK